MIRFGGIQTIDALVSYVHNTAGSLIVGMVSNVTQLAGFNLAYNLTVNLPGTINTVLNRSIFPSFSRLQAERERIIGAYMKLVSITGLVNFPILIGMGLISNELVFVLFGERWLWIVAIVQALAFSGCARAITNPIGTLFMGIGKPSIPLYINILRTALVVGGSLLAAPKWGAIGIAYVLAGSAIVTLAANYVVLFRFFRLPLRLFARTIFGPALLVLPMVLGVLLVQFLLRDSGWHPIFLLITSVITGVSLFVGTLCLARDKTSLEVLRLLSAARLR